MKTIFINGASSGLGKATAKFFASKGWKVIATMRRPELENELNRFENITIVNLDVADIEEIYIKISELLNFYSVDVVLNNAGYAYRTVGRIDRETDPTAYSDKSTWCNPHYKSI